VKLFVNKKNMDFSGVETAVPTQALTLTEAQAAGEAVALKFVNFQNVVSLTVCQRNLFGFESCLGVYRVESRKQR
jgi:hypothetical protein